MKKFLTIVLVAILAISFAACGENKESIEGTWKVDFVEYEGSKFTASEWHNMEDEDFTNFYIIFKEGGKAYIFDGEYDQLVDWFETEDCIVLDGEQLTLVDEKLCLDDGYKLKLYLIKTSDSQEIPKKTEEPTVTDEPTNKPTSQPTAEATDKLVTDKNNNNTATQNDWRQFLKDYETWVDKYIDISKKYQNKPTDMTLFNEYMELASEMTEWAERADEMELEIEDANEALEYSKELLRIITKLSEAY